MAGWLTWAEGFLMLALTLQRKTRYLGNIVIKTSSETPRVLRKYFGRSIDWNTNTTEVSFAEYCYWYS